MKRLTYFWRRGIWTISSVFFVVLILISALLLYVNSQLPHVDTLKRIHLQVPLRIYSQDGLLIQEYGEKRRIPVAYKDIPPTLVRAVLATEDQRFFEHPGVDIFGLGRAAIRMIQTGTKSQGGSTITMQVARNFFLEREKTFLRKFNEIMLAIKIDRKLSKEKILELYLNKIYLGNRAYGVGAAAQIYYGKTLNELTLAQLAMIAGLPQAPSAHNPIANPVAALKRRNHVLERLLEEEYITQEEYDEAIKQPITASYHGAKLEVHAPYVAEMLRQSLYAHFGPDAYTRGYKVYTTIKGPLQNQANAIIEDNLLAYEHRHGYRGATAKVAQVESMSPEEIRATLRSYPVVNSLEPAIILSVGEKEATAVTRSGNTVTIPWSGLSWAKRALKKGWFGSAPTQAKQVVSPGDVVYLRQQNGEWALSQVPNVEAALVAINPKNGAIETLVGGLNFQRSKFNRATQSERQPGSSFKPFIYAAALSKGYTLATLVNDAPIAIDDPSQANLWRPHNHNLTFNGPTRLREALVKSRNLVSIRILDDIGVDYALDFLGRFGFSKANLPRALSLALGSLTISPLDITTAYAVFANGGFKVEPYLIDHITDADDEILLQAKPVHAYDPHDDQDQNPDLHAPRVLSEDVAFLMDSTLREVIQKGTGRAALVLKRNDLAGKTGTTNDRVDAWFTGYSPDLVVTTWVGFDNPRSLHEYASKVALPMWIDFMRVALEGKPEQETRPPENIVAVHINPRTGLLANKERSDAIVEYFRKEDIPNIEELSIDITNRSAGPATTNAPQQESLF